MSGTPIYWYGIIAGVIWTRLCDVFSSPETLVRGFDYCPGTPRGVGKPGDHSAR